MASGGTAINTSFQLDAVAKLAFERPALALCYPSLKHSTDASKLAVQSLKDPGSHGPAHPTVTVLLASLVELERRGLIGIGGSASRTDPSEREVIWATKKAPYCPGEGTSAELFNCIAHGHSPLEDVVAKYFRDHPQDPWTLASYLGIQEAKWYGYLTWQMWPAKGIKGWLSHMGLAEDVQTLWVRDGLKVREATQASRLMRVHIDEFRSKAPALYEALRSSILEAVHKLEEPVAHRIIKLPHLTKRLAH